MADPFHVFGLNLVLFDYLLFALFSFVIGLIKSFVLTYIIRENVVRKSDEILVRWWKLPQRKFYPTFTRSFPKVYSKVERCFEILCTSLRVFFSAMKILSPHYFTEFFCSHFVFCFWFSSSIPKVQRYL